MKGMDETTARQMKTDVYAAAFPQLSKLARGAQLAFIIARSI